MRLLNWLSPATILIVALVTAIPPTPAVASPPIPIQPITAGVPDDGKPQRSEQSTARLTEARAGNGCDDVQHRAAELAAKGYLMAICMGNTGDPRKGDSSINVAPPANVPAWCETATPWGYWWARDRFEQCAIAEWDWTIIDTGTGLPVGGAHSVLGHDQAGLAPDGSPRDWYDDIFVGLSDPWGIWPNMAAVVTAECIGGRPCNVREKTGDLAGLSFLNTGDSVRGKAVFDNSGSTTIDTMYTHFTIYIYPQAPNITPGSFTWSSADLRCDSTWGNRQNACAIPWYTPTMGRYFQSSPSHGQIAQHIARAMRTTQNHWGWRGVGQPLSLTRDEALKRANNRAACGNVVSPPLHSCDEYPFESTYEGASRNSDYSIEDVLENQNSSAGSILGNWYADQRMIEHDQFWVHINA